MPPKRPDKPGNGDESKEKKPNTNTTPPQSPDPNPASLSPDRRSDGSVSSSYGSVGTGSSVSSGSDNGLVVDLTNRLRTRFHLDEAAIRALLDDRPHLDPAGYLSVLPGGNRFYDGAMIAMSSGTDEESSDSSPPPPPVPARGHLAYTGPFLFHESTDRRR